jgi:hypothetical protein
MSVTRADRSLGWLRVLALALSFALLLLVAAAGPSAAKPGLGPRGWAPGDLPISLSSAVVTALLWTAYLLGGLAVGLGLWRGSSSDRNASGWGRWARPGLLSWLRDHSWLLPLALGALALLTAPIGSADHTNYAAYGRISAQGGDPYLVPPITWAGGTDPVTSAVEPPWTMTPSVYGPFSTALQTLSSLVGQDNLRQTVWVWQLLIVGAWLLVRYLLRLTAVDELARKRIDLVWTANPIVFGVAVLGAHVDLIATALALAAVLLAAKRPWAAGVVLGTAVSSKITYGIVGLAILWSWRSLARKPLVRNTIALAVSSLGVFVSLHLWAGPHVFEQLLKGGKGVSLATALRPVVNLLSAVMPLDAARTVGSVASVVVFILLAAALSRLARSRRIAPQTTTAKQASDAERTQSAMTATFVLATAYALAAPYALPWYSVLTWATLPMLLATTLDAILLVQLTVMAMAYVPGRVVAMSPDVESLTLGFRKIVGPLAAWLVWLAIAGVASRGWSRVPRASRPPAS